ncbi:MAG: TonB-dependent receptor [Bradyrhizobium sp.]|nr:TonB-dependent receptor [Bradyrhizobium sp.]
MRKRVLLATILSSGSALAASGALAQTAQQAATTPAESTAPDQPSAADIIVTAQKREERIMDVPIAITVVSGDALAASGAKNITELQGVTPGLFASGNTGYAGSPIAIRGTAGTNSTLLDDPVAVYVNGVYQPSGTFSSTALLDIASIQVVRGPQGTLQGRNATAGAVLIDTPNPGVSLNGYLRTSYADPSEIRGEGAIGGPLSDTLGARVAVGYYDENGWGRNTFNNQPIGGGRGFSARGTLRWRPTSALDVRLYVGHIFTYAEPATARYAATPFNPLPTGPLIVAGTATPTTPLSAAEIAALEDGQFALNRPSFNRNTDDSIALNLTYGIGGVDLVSVTGYDKVQLVGAADSDGLARTDREGFNTGILPSKNFSQELRLQSSGNGAFSWILGAYYSSSIQDMDFLIDNLQLTVPDRRVTRFLAHQDTRSYAGFADATYHVTPELAIIGGIRYTRETKTFAFDRTISNYDTGASLAPLFQYRPNQAVFTNTSFRVKATYQPTRDVLLYASYSTGFKSGGFNAFGSDPAFNPEKLRSAEVGIKASLLDRHATIALSVYSNHYDNLQVRVGVPSGGIAITNAANSKIDGFELEGSLHPTSEFSFTGNIAYTNARFSSFPLARNLLDQGPFDASGNKLPRTPAWQYYLQGSYTPHLSDTLTGLLEASYRWRSRIYLYQTDQTSPTVQGKPVGELGLRAGFTLVPSQIAITAFATNLTNARSVNGVNITFSYPNVSYNKPRTFGIQLEKKF